MEGLYERIVLLCRKKGITPSFMCDQLHIRKAVISDFKAGRTKSMHTDTIASFAEYLGTSCDYLLLGREFRMTDEENALLNAWRHASDAEKQNVAFILRDHGMVMPAPSEEEARVG